MPQKYRWKIKEKISDDLATQLLYNRGLIKNKKEKKAAIKSFLYPNPKNDLFDPFELSDLKKAAQRIIIASRKKEKVGIFGDYDADGIPGSAVLYEGFQKLGIEAKVYIPDRSEGYGFSKKAVKYFKENGISLIITIDCGIRDLKGVNYARKQGIDVIICDHHEQGHTLPKAYAVIDPKKKGEKYPFRELSGAAVGFKLIQGLSKLSKSITNEFLRTLLDLVAISVISDIVPLISENRVFAKFGLIGLRKTQRLGLQELYKVAQIKPENLNAHQVGFMIGPRINAPGRMYSPRIAFDLLVTKDKKQAQKIAEILNEVNKERQRETERFLKQARGKIKKDKLQKNKVILLQHNEWPSGLVGLIASKIKDEYNRPVFIFQKGEKISRGSARSIDGFHLAEILLSGQKLIKKGGGHAKAAGLEVANEKMQEFYDYLLEMAEQNLKEDDLIPDIEIEMEMPCNLINWQTYKLVENFEPYGLANPRPKFLTCGWEVSQIKTMGNGEKHLSMILVNDKQNFRAVFFGAGSLFPKIKRGDKIDVVYTIDSNDFTGQPKLELHIEDIRISL